MTAASELYFKKPGGGGDQLGALACLILTEAEKIRNFPHQIQLSSSWENAFCKIWSVGQSKLGIERLDHFWPSKDASIRSMQANSNLAKQSVLFREIIIGRKSTKRARGRDETTDKPHDINLLKIWNSDADIRPQQCQVWGKNNSWMVYLFMCVKIIISDFFT